MSRTSKIARRTRLRHMASPEMVGEVYLSAPKSEEGTERYARQLAVIEELLPDAYIVEALTLYEDVAAWRIGMPEIMATMSALVFLTAPGGWVGRGGWAEIQSALQLGLPVLYLTDEDHLVPFASLTCSPPDESDWRRYVQVTPRSGE